MKRKAAPKRRAKEQPRSLPLDFFSLAYLDGKPPQEKRRFWPFRRGI